MAITDNDYTDYVNTDSRDLGDSEGVILPESIAKGFSYAKRVLKTGGFLGGIGGIVSAPWRVRVRESADPASQILFEQRVIYRVLEVIGGTFIPQDDPNPDLPWSEVTTHTLIQTTIINGEPVAEREAWHQVDTSTPTKYSEIGTSIFRPNSGWIDVDWRSPRYRLDLPAGAVFQVVEDGWRSGAAIPIDYYEVSILRGAEGRRVDSALDAFGDLLVARVEHGSKISRLARMIEPLEKRRCFARGFVPGIEPSILMNDDGEIVMGAMAVEGYAEWVSNNDGARFERAKYPDADAGVLQEDELWPKVAKMPLLAKIEGGRVTIAIQDGNLMARTIREGGGFGSAGIVGGPVAILKAASDQSYSISEDDHGALWVFDDDGVPRAVSRDGSGAWKEVGAGSLVNV